VGVPDARKKLGEKGIKGMGTGWEKDQSLDVGDMGVKGQEAGYFKKKRRRRAHETLSHSDGGGMLGSTAPSPVNDASTRMDSLVAVETPLKQGGAGKRDKNFPCETGIAILPL